MSIFLPMAVCPSVILIYGEWLEGSVYRMIGTRRASITRNLTEREGKTLWLEERSSRKNLIVLHVAC